MWAAYHCSWIMVNSSPSRHQKLGMSHSHCNWPRDPVAAAAPPLTLAGSPGGYIQLVLILEGGLAHEPPLLRHVVVCRVQHALGQRSQLNCFLNRRCAPQE